MGVRLVVLPPVLHCMLKGYRNSRKQGDVGLAAAIYYFAAKEYTVCVPLTDSQKFDLIVEKNNKVERVQAKTTSHRDRKTGPFKVSLRTCGGNRSNGNRVVPFDHNAVDLVFVLCDDGSKYLIPVGAVSGSCFNLGAAFEQYKVR